jgi:hypothetical protein
VRIETTLFSSLTLSSLLSIIQNMNINVLVYLVHLQFVLVDTQFLPISHRHIRHICSNDLLYGTRSPDDCRMVNSIFGTHGRYCNNSLSNHSEGSCDYLCCGRGFTIKRYILQKQCHCHYAHCCYIQRDTCFEQIEENICK